MLVWVIYDICNDKRRRKIINYCMDSGLYRVQKSVFLGNIEYEEEIEELKNGMECFVEDREDSIYIFPMSDRGLKKSKFIGKAFDKDLITDEIITKFF